MKIGILGAGHLGTGLAKRLRARGHDVMLGLSRTQASLEGAAAAVGVGHGSPEQVCAHGEVVVLATPWAITPDTVCGLADRLAGKVLWDTTNALKPDLSGMALGTTTSGGEQVALAAPRAKVVKAIAPFAELLHAPPARIAGRLPGVFACGDDAQARKIVLGLVADIEAEGIEAGPLILARYVEPLGMLLVQLAYTQSFGTRLGAALLHEPSGTSGSSG